MGRLQDLAALDRALARLAAPGAAAAGMEIRPFGRRTTLGALLAAVDATLLAQTLQVTNATGETLRLDAGNGRLRQVRPEGPCPVPACALEPRDAAALHDLRPALEAFTADGALRMEPEPIDEAAPTGPAGVAAVDLAALWGLRIAPEAPPEPAEALERILHAHRGAIYAWRLDTGEQDLARGDEAARDALATLAERMGEPAGVLDEGTIVSVERSGYALVLFRRDGALAGVAAVSRGADAIVAQLQEMLLGWG